MPHAEKYDRLLNDRARLVQENQHLRAKVRNTLTPQQVKRRMTRIYNDALLRDPNGNALLAVWLRLRDWLDVRELKGSTK